MLARVTIASLIPSSAAHCSWKIAALMSASSPRWQNRPISWYLASSWWIYTGNINTVSHCPVHMDDVQQWLDKSKGPRQLETQLNGLIIKTGTAMKQQWCRTKCCPRINQRKSATITKHTKHSDLWRWTAWTAVNHHSLHRHVYWRQCWPVQALSHWYVACSERSSNSVHVRSKPAELSSTETCETSSSLPPEQQQSTSDETLSL